MISYTIPNRDNSTDKTIAVTKSEANWIKTNMKPIELELVGWLKNQNPADLIAIITGDLRNTTQATRTRLYQRQLINSNSEPLTLEHSRRLWRHFRPQLQEALDQTRSNVLGTENFIKVKLDRTDTVWCVAPFYFNTFVKKLIKLAYQ